MLWKVAVDWMLFYHQVSEQYYRYIHDENKFTNIW